MRLSSRLLLLTFVSLLPLPALANEPRQHDSGFFLRLSPLGLGSVSTKADDDIDSLKFSGLAGTADLAVGFVIKPNLVLHANAGGWSIIDPKTTINGTEFETEDLSVTLTTLGLGVTYYMGESNTYLTASLAAASINVELDGEDEDTGTGIAFEVGAGKEWWIGKKWGIGLGAVFNYHSVPAENDFDANFKGASFGVRANATFN